MKLKLLLPFLGLIFLAGCSSVKDPEFRRVENFRVKNFGIQEVSIGFSVTYYNPNNFGVTVKEAEADIYMDSVYMGRFNQDSLISVNKKAEFSVPLSGKISLATALKLDLTNIGERKIFVKADGTVKVGKAGIYVTKPIVYEGSHNLSELNIQ